MSSFGASAICTRKIRSGGIELIAEDPCREQAHGMNRAPTRRTDGSLASRPPTHRGNRGCAAPRRAPRSRRATRALRRARRVRGNLRPPCRFRRAESGETLLQTIRRSQPSCSMTSNLRSARAKTLDRCGSGIPSKSPEGLESDRAEPEILDHAACLCRRAVERQKIVLEDLDAFELRGRDSFDLLASVPLRQTVAMAVRMLVGPFLFSIRKPSWFFRC